MNNPSEFITCATGVYGNGVGLLPGLGEVWILNSNLSTYTSCTKNTYENETHDNVHFVNDNYAPEWAVGESYQLNNNAFYNDVLYRCIQPHTAYSPSWTPPNTPALWVLE